MRQRVCLVAAVVLLASIPAGGPAAATPTLPYMLVNHTTRQCFERWLGDDCHWCEPPVGWDVLGEAHANPCPAGYTMLNDLELTCVEYENQFCCTSASHRGDCSNLVVSRSKQMCAFVPDAGTCVLPEGWQNQAGADPLVDWSCPTTYAWVTSVACLQSSTIQQVPAGGSTVTAGSEASGGPAVTPQVGAGDGPAVAPGSDAAVRPLEAPGDAGAYDSSGAGQSAPLTALLVAAGAGLASGILIGCLLWRRVRR